MERAALMAHGGVILPEHLPARILKTAEDAKSGVAEPPSGKRMVEIERDSILKALQDNSFSRTETARALGISRRTLIYKLQRYGEQGFSINHEEH